MVKTIAKLIIFATVNMFLLYAVLSCTPDVMEAQDEETLPNGAVLVLAAEDTFYVIDTSSVFDVSAYFIFDSMTVPDSTKIRFTASGAGSIEETGYTENGAAVVEYNPFIDGSVFSGSRTITASSAINGYPAKDEKKIYVKNMLDDGPELKLLLWSMVKDTFVVVDTSSTLPVYASVNIGSLPVKDSTNVKFYADFGSITTSSLTSEGEANAVFSPFTTGGTILSGRLNLKAKVSAYNQTIWDSISIYIKNPADTSTVVPDTTFNLNLWTLATDTFFVRDSADVLNVYANVKYDTLNAPDGTSVNFLVDQGSITEQSSTSDGLAKAVYAPLMPSGEIVTGDITIISSTASSQQSVYDTLAVYVKDITNTGQDVPQDTTYTLELWTMQTDTFFINDSLDVLNIYADVRSDTLNAPDGTSIRFYTNFGSITEESEISEGQAKAVYTPKSLSGNYLSGELFIKAAVANDTLVYDSLKIQVENRLLK